MSTSTRLLVVDVTGDGVADIVGFGNAGVYVSRNNGNGTFQAPQLVVQNFGYDAGGWRVDQHPRFVVDVTGDGVADIVGFGNAGVYVSRNNGNGTFQAPQLVVQNFGYDAGGWRVDQHPRFVVDVTGDGRADIVGFGNAGVSCATTATAPSKYHSWSSRTLATTPELACRPAPALRRRRDGRRCCGHRRLRKRRGLCWQNNGNGTFQAPQLVVQNFGYDAGGWRVDQHPRSSST